MTYPMAPTRPDWTRFDRDAVENSYVTITRGTARLAMSALREQMALDYYANYGAAERELATLLEAPLTAGK